MKKRTDSIGQRLQEIIDSGSGMRRHIREAAEVSNGAISHWLKRGSLGWDSAVRIAKHLGISLDWLMLGRGTMYAWIPLEDLCPGAEENDDDLEWASSMVHVITEEWPQEAPAFISACGYVATGTPYQIAALREVWGNRHNLAMKEAE